MAGVELGVSHMESKRITGFDGLVFDVSFGVDRFEGKDGTFSDFFWEVG